LGSGHQCAMTAQEEKTCDNNTFCACWLSTGRCDAARLGKEPGSKGFTQVCRVPPMGWKSWWTELYRTSSSAAGRATAPPMARHRSVRQKPLYLDATAPIPAGGAGESMRSEPAGLDVPGRWTFGSGDGGLLNGRHPVSPGVEHAAYGRTG
jgi:hypothetical protein